MKKVMYLFLVLVLHLPLYARTVTTGNELFRQALSGEESFDAAAADYVRLINEGETDLFSLYYNLGNTLYLADDPVAALAAYGAALKLKPSDEDCIANRNLVLGELELEAPVPDAAGSFLHGPVLLFGVKAAGVILLFLTVSAFGAALLFLIVKKPVFRTISVILLVLSLLMSGSLFSWNPNPAVIAQDNTALRRGDSPLYEPLAVLQAGTSIHIIEERKGWFRVKTGKTASSVSQTGWIQDTQMIDIQKLIDRYQ
ncbi:MAG: SH3 domain-containing protein [Spirochaetales bacterium]|nr:SH3 domain-containing protein [Spirochaetales bacterium]